MNEVSNNIYDLQQNSERSESSDNSYGSLSRIPRPYKISEINYAGGELYGQYKIARFIQIHHISLQQFWKSNRNHANYQDICSFCESVGLHLNSEDEVQMRSQLFSDNAVISIYDFCQLVQPWQENSRERVLNLFKNRSEQLADGINQKIRQNSLTKQTLKCNRPTSSKHSVQNIHKLMTRPASSTGMYTNKSKEYLKKQRQKQNQIQRKLSVAINKAKDEYEYQLLIRMGEANDLNRDMQSVQTFRAYKNAQGNLRVRVFNLDRFVREIKPKEFQKEFNDIKKRFNETKKISIWQQLSTTKKDKGISQIRNPSPQSQGVKKADRQKQLISILTDTINLTNVLKGQLRILKNQGIYKKA